MANIFRCEICGKFISYAELDNKFINIKEGYEWDGENPESVEWVSHYTHKSCDQKAEVR